MTYNKTVYVNDTVPPISAENLNNSENGIFNANNEVRELIEIINETEYSFKALSSFATSNNARLNENDGFSHSDVNYKLLKYRVAPGDLLRIISDDRFQFQSADPVPVSGTTTRIGVTYGTGDYLIKVPAGAITLIISTPNTSAAFVYEANSQTTAIKNDMVDLKNDIGLFTDDTIYTFVKGAYIKSDLNVGDTANLTPIADVNLEYIMIDCAADDVFMRIAWGASTARQYMFVDSSNKVLSVATSYAESNVYTKLAAPTNAAKLIINSRLVKGNAKVYKSPTIAERVYALETGEGTELTYSKNATQNTAYDARSAFFYNAASLSGRTVKIKIECDASIFPNGIYWMSGNGKYLSGSPQLYLPNKEYVVKVGDSFATSGNNYSGLYGAASLVGASGSVKLYFYPEFDSGVGFLEYKIDEISKFVPVGDRDLLSWGDSLTAGAGGEGTTYPSVCASELNISFLNCGVGGETGNTIAARQGGNSVIIPAGNVNGDYTELIDIYGTPIAPLLQGSGGGSSSKIFINGVECSLAYSNSKYTISGYTKGASTVPLLGRFAGSDFHGKIVTIWCGANGSRIGSDTSVNARITIIDSMIKNIGHDHYIIFANWKANGVETDFTEDDAAMLSHYGNKFFPVRKMLVDNGLTLMGITPTAQDLTDISNGTIPTSLRSDSVHLNADGYTAVGKFLADKIRSLGYV